ncbi:hypothetical protein GLYMA_05G171466v4 [Glycine max]|nr:hypothetical protein GLYMA_05G171466v4 [Glycine max]KAH1134879.1 hypothetical protein GYH30_012945 [Glycine max]
MCNDLFFFLSLIIGLFLICTLLPVFNVQSESRCPPYTKKRLIPDSTVISTRHASLRSAKKLIETRGTSVDVAQMKKASEDENPVANHSVQMEEHNAFEAQFIPFEQEHLEEDIEASNSGESSDKNNDKSISMVGHPSFCLNLLNLLIWGTMRLIMLDKDHGLIRLKDTK